MKTIFVISFFICSIQLSFSQTYIELGINQPPQLQADAGTDTEIFSGTLVTLGGYPTATGGTTVYTYLWSPADGLSSTTEANPDASPAQTTTYTLTVIDAAGCTAIDEVVVLVSYLIDANNKDDIRLFPNPGRHTVRIEFNPELKFSKCTILDIEGKILDGQEIVPGSSAIEPDVSKLTSGTYIIRLSNNKKYFDKPFICE